VHEADEPDAIGDFPDAEVLPGEHTTEIDLAPAKARVGFPPVFKTPRLGGMMGPKVH
jgi:hypothetical protein